MKRIAVLISNTGTGTNLQAIIDAIQRGEINAQLAVVFSDSVDAQGLQRAQLHSVPTETIDKNADLEHLLKDKYRVDYVALAGWKQFIPDSLIDTFANKILNIHPGLIPDRQNGEVQNPDGTTALWNKGKLTEKAIGNFIDSGATYAGSTVHFLTHEFDFGPVLGRCFEKINPADTIESLYRRLKKKENQMYVKALEKLCE